MNESDTPHAYMAQRILAGFVALPLTAYGLLFLFAALQGKFDFLTATFGPFIGTLAVLGWWFALRGQFAESRRRMKVTVRGGFVVGGIGFAAGFFGPIILTPSANQGPLLGIFVTGPLGFVVGIAAGWLYTRIKDRDASPGGISRAA